MPEPQREAVRLAEFLGRKPVFRTARMDTAKAPETALSRIFGITSFKLG